MEALAEHKLEADVAAPAPRPLHLPLRVRILLGVAVLLLGLFVLGSGRALWEGIKLAWLAQAGQTTSGRIIEVRSEAAAPGGQDSRQIAVRYLGLVPGADGAVHPRTGWIALTQETPSPNALPAKPPVVLRFHVGQPVPLRYASVLGITVSQPWGAYSKGRSLGLIGLGGSVQLVSLLLLRRLLRGVRGQWRLLRHGTATVGTITHTRSEAEDIVRYFVRYGYPVGADRGREHEEQVSAEQWRMLHVGQPVTVLFDPNQPERAGLYTLIVQK